MSLTLEQIFLRREELPIVQNGRFVTVAPIHPVLRDPTLDFDRDDISIATDFAIKDWKLDMEEQSKMDSIYSKPTKYFLEKFSPNQRATFRDRMIIEIQPADIPIEVEFDRQSGFVKDIKFVVPHIYINDRDAYIDGKFTEEKKEFYKRSRKFERHNFHNTPFYIDSLLNRIGMHAVNIGMSRAYEKGLLKL